MEHHIIRPYIKEVNLEELARSVPKEEVQRKEDKDKTAEEKAKSGVIITPATDFWQVSGVEYKNGIYPVDLSKSLLENVASKTQDKWVERYEAVKDKGDFYTPDYPLFYGLLKAVYSSNKPEKDEIQKFIRDASRANWLMTLTRIAYTPKGLDKVIHNYGTKDMYEEDVDFITKDGKITKTGKPKSYQALLGTKDSVKEINEVFNWLNGTDAYAWKVNNKPAQLDERVAWFVAGSDRADLNCVSYPTGSNASLGVRFAPQGAAQNFLGVK